MSDADYTPSRLPRSIAASLIICPRFICRLAVVVVFFLSQELCQCFYQLKSFEAELFDASEKSDEGGDVDDDDAEQRSNSEPDVDEQLNDDSPATDSIERQTPSAKQTQPRATHDFLQEKIKDMINVAHVSRHVNWK